MEPLIKNSKLRAILMFCILSIKNFFILYISIFIVKFPSDVLVMRINSRGNVYTFCLTTEEHLISFKFLKKPFCKKENCLIKRRKILLKIL